MKIRWLFVDGGVWILETPISGEHEMVTVAFRRALDNFLDPVAISSDQMLCHGGNWSQSADLSYIPEQLPSPDPNPDPITNRPWPRLVVEVRITSVRLLIFRLGFLSR